jgi:hypothetical protein
VSESKHYAIKSLALGLDFSAYTTDFIHLKDGSPKDVGEVTMEPAVRSSGFENFD